MQPFFKFPISAGLTCVTGLGVLAVAWTAPAPTPVVDASLASLTRIDPNDDDRGSGRVRKQTDIIHLSLRGSGRINPDPNKPSHPQAVQTPLAYRGSGRIDPITPGGA